MDWSINWEDVVKVVAKLAPWRGTVQATKEQPGATVKEVIEAFAKKKSMQPGEARLRLRRLQGWGYLLTQREKDGRKRRLYWASKLGDRNARDH